MWVSLRSLSQRCQPKLKAWECPWFQWKPTVAHCRPLVDGISTIQYSNWASISFFEKLYGAELINSFLWNGATDKPYAARITWSDINPPQKECWLDLCKNMAAIIWSIWRLFATLGSIWEVTTLDGSWGWRKASICWDKKWEMEIKSFTNITIGKFNENLCMTDTDTASASTSSAKLFSFIPIGQWYGHQPGQKSRYACIQDKLFDIQIACLDKLEWAKS